MKRWVMIISGVLAALIVLFALVRREKKTGQPITLCYIRTGEFTNVGYISTGTTFWVTNHTPNTLVMHLSAIEVKNGSTWIKQRPPVSRMVFRHPGTGRVADQLSQHEAGYVTLNLVPQPTGTIWRACANVQELLRNGSLEDIAARVKRFPKFMSSRVYYGNTNAPVNVFSKSLTFYGSPIEVVSQQVSQE